MIQVAYDLPNLFDVHEGLVSGRLCGYQAGLIEQGESPFFTQPRVAAFGRFGIDEANIVKFRSMEQLTEYGRYITDSLIAEGMCTKEAHSWRVSNAWQRLIRKSSIDELPQLFYNVMHLGGDEFDDLLIMNLFGSGRPIMPHEVVWQGDNAYDPFAKALQEIARENNESPEDLYNYIGFNFVPGLYSPANAWGFRQVSDVAGCKAWIYSNLQYAEIQKLPYNKRHLEIVKSTGRVVRHVLQGSDAA